MRSMLGLAAALVVACDDPKGAQPTSRSEQVLSSSAATTSPAPVARAPHASPTPARATKLCAGDGNARGRTFPKTLFVLREASVPEPRRAAFSVLPSSADDDPSARGQWTWVNFWAAWCRPCKEEMPRLTAWQSKLRDAGAPIRFAFVSLDDDLRQLHSFLEQQPATGLKTTLWLEEGRKRTSLLASLKMKDPPNLPEQVLVDPNGKVRCFVEGAVEDGDYAELAEILSH